MGLHHAAELDLVGEIGRRHQDVGENHRGLRIASGKRRQPLGPAHDAIPVFDDAAEALGKPLAFGSLALQQRNLFGVLADPNQIEAEIRLEALLLKIKPDQRGADPLGQGGSENGIDQRAPYQIPRDCELAAEDRQWSRRGETPQDDDKRHQRHH